MSCKAHGITGKIITERERMSKSKSDVFRKLKLTSHGIIVLFVVSGSTKKLLLIDFILINIYLFSIFFSIDFTSWKSVGLPHITYIVIH